MGGVRRGNDGHDEVKRGDLAAGVIIIRLPSDRLNER
jgi:hypothetical protein